jgi:hypothetical protein
MALSLLALRAVFAAEQAPVLRPPRGMLLPSFWEQHGGLLFGLAVVTLAVLAATFWWRRRPKASIVTPPEVLARRALQALQGRTEDDALALEVSRVLRGFLTAALGLPHAELTTAEFDGALHSRRAVSEELIPALVGFLRECDVKKFAPVQPPAPPGLVARALELIDRVQAERTSAPPVAAATT